MKLDVHVAGKRVASLYRERDEYVMAYETQDPQDFVCLTMPVRDQPFRWPRDLHPFFRQNLPEGFLLQILREEFSRELDGTDLSLLALVGRAGIGRVAVTPEGVGPGQEAEPIDFASLMHGQTTTAQFTDLVRRYARAAISGVVPKFIAPEPADAPNEAAGPAGASFSGKSTFRGSRHIIKGSGDRFPFLAFNEHYAMQVLARLGVAPVAKTELSEDGRILVVERFDVDGDGKPTHGVEDACGLLGLAPNEKYAPSMEQVLNAMRVYLPSGARHDQLVKLGWHIITNFVIRNADCHSKNIALYYTTLDDVAFTPVFDLVTTQAYTGYADQNPGLSIEGRKTWAPGKSLEKFFKGRLGIGSSDYKKMVERVCESAVDVGREVIELGKNNTEWHGVAKNMAHAWNQGMSSIRDQRTPKRFMGLSAAIERAGFSGADEMPKGARVDESPLMARRARRSPR